MMRKAIFGGTFDPIHNGHMHIAYEALYNLNLDLIIFMPSGNPPHKTQRKVTEGKIRYEIVESVIKDEARFDISDYEINSNELSYTYKTLKHFNDLEPNTEWFFITGADSLIDLERWRNVKGILENCTLIVFTRPGYSLEEIKKQKKNIEEKYNTDIIFLNMPVIDISSTVIKKKISENKNVKYLLPYEPYKIIEKLNLYK
ncbi:nicotinate-nucleotide adenylyltransferase [Clostridium sp. UBA6640]|uniref:nicotinate-nucleotide adenylyltransferase n=1 Tax=Clostridium sp. UBA6640 TaxID=1946370 RepID=UPI0025C71E7D|nr:nicotinate-nucleotide adenylyltransferase [Clostridium sp. UBA6640]